MRIVRLMCKSLEQQACTLQYESQWVLKMTELELLMCR